MAPAPPRPIDVTIDLSEAQRAAHEIRSRLLELRSQYDLSAFEYTRAVRISPGRIPHSHPVLTLNTFVRDKDALLCVYLHEQMHWYTTWFAHRRKAEWASLRSELQTRYPKLPVGFPEGAHTEDSSYLHLIVNWLEIDACANLLGVSRARELAERNFVYSGIYKMVLEDWDDLASLYASQGLCPRLAATEMSEDDLTVAGRGEMPDIPR